MPVYEFVCPNGHRIEDVRMIGDTEPPRCQSVITAAMDGDEPIICGEKMTQVIGKGIAFYNAGGATQTRRSWN